jgi:hypothetical protein
MTGLTADKEAALRLLCLVSHGRGSRENTATLRSNGSLELASRLGKEGGVRERVAFGAAWRSPWLVAQLNGVIPFRSPSSRPPCPPYLTGRLNSTKLFYDH